MQAPAVDESRRAGEAAGDHVHRLARAKVRAVAADWPVLAADTIVTVDAEIFGKPDNQAHFETMLSILSGREHDVLTAVALRWQEREAIRIAAATVSLRPISRAEMTAYWETGEPRDKAGGYGIQGIGGIFARIVHGSYSAVVGLPLVETEQLLQSFGIDTWRWRRQKRPCRSCRKNSSLT